MSLVLGINAWHGDSAAAIVRDGRLIAAVEEERFNRIKHWAGLPVESMKFCLREAGVKFPDLEHVAINLNPRVHNFRRLWHLLKHRPEFGLIFERLRKRGKAQGVGERIAGVARLHRTNPPLGAREVRNGGDERRHTGDVQASQRSRRFVDAPEDEAGARGSQARM